MCNTDHILKNYKYVYAFLKFSSNIKFSFKITNCSLLTYF